MFDMVASERRAPPDVISLNYDLLAERALIIVAQHHKMRPFPDYGCDVETPAYKRARGSHQMLKLHGSVNWRYCAGCHRLQFGVTQQIPKSARALTHEIHDATLRFEHLYAQRANVCRGCGGALRALMIAPTSRKDYRNPHITSIWYRAERLSQSADRVIFVGYSLPENDVDVIYLLKRSLSNLPPEKVTVVEFDKSERTLESHPVGQRYRSLFGSSIEWSTAGFMGWLAKYDQADQSILTRSPTRKGPRIWRKARP